MTEINLSTLLSILKKSLIYIIMAAIVFTLGAFIFCEFIATPTYQAKISFIGANSSSFASQTGDDYGDIKTTDISASRALILTYVDIFKAEDFFDKMTSLGVTTVICTDISKDGAMKGVNRELYKQLSDKYSIDITASGGVTDISDIESLRKMDLYGAIIGKAYYTGAIDLKTAIEVAK